MSGSPPGAPAPLQYIPEPHERPYYLGLFQVADVKQQGQIAGPEAVQFFTRSKLPIETLKHVWTVADQPATNALDHKKFAVAVRLIQCMQNGQRGQGMRLETPPGVTLRPVMFEGVSGTVVPFPPENGGGPPPSPGGAPDGRPPMGPPGARQPSMPPQQQQMAASMRAASPAPSLNASVRGPSPVPPQTPVRGGPSPVPTTPNMRASSALTVQDPYGMTPSDLSRYQDVCKEYAKPDGFVYGGEAVALFSKSGMPQDQLAAIWNMVDVPVDNRLDPVEFGMAMHLIVCVSKKGMPMPTALPPSLAAIKQQQAGGPPPMPQPEEQMPPPAAMAAAGAGVAAAGMAAPEPQQQLQPPPQMEQPPAPEMQQQLGGPPPLGGMNISDAFDGLDPSPTAAAGPGDAAPSYGMEEPPASEMPPPPQMTAAAAVPSPQMEQPTPQQQPPAVSMQPTVGVAMSVPVGGGSDSGGGIPAPAAAAVASSSGSSSDELAQAKELLQKLQAENISLKAQLSNFSEEEMEAQRELALTVSEIARLNSVLTGLRGEALSAKGRLADLTAAVKSSKDNVSMLNGLIEEETATKNALVEANQELETTMAAAAAGGGLAAAAAAPPAVVASDDVFGFSAAAQPTMDGPPSVVGDDLSATSGPIAVPESQSSYVADPQMSGEIMAPASGDMMAPPSGDMMAPPSGDMTAPSQSGEMMAPPAQQQTQPSMDVYGAPPAFASGPPITGGMPDQNAAANGGYHNRNLSTASAFGFGDDAAIMGGGPPPFTADPRQGVAPTPVQQSAPTSASVASAAPVPSVPESSTMDADALSEMRRKAKDADDVAREAEQSSRTQMQRVNELRAQADAAQEQAQRKTAELNDGGKKKKKGMFGGGGKKKDAKEVEQLNLDARLKKDALLQAQAQANDAQALAFETKREADKLRKELEDAELAAASSASLQHQQPASPSPAPQQQAPPQSYGGYQQQQQQMPPQNIGMSNGGQGYQIPTPNGDAYSNPFG
eukprot:CAMPEP_0172447012 /NCGR_PEP_ID=MMETSP1065-20121228/6408_1 /TAXON_ID=265537 /ORGANISM="Amphiprora paludosa, Strain CCMP125" /LENGTH=998 /DNA_ID=CAMNT_0013198205 /DNA_START=21 /DNA_END=3017 /DNA_ORIENTATION=-